MRAVFVYLDPLDGLAVDIAADVIPAVDHQAALPGVCCLPGEHAAEQPRADDQIVVLVHDISHSFLL